MEVTYTCDLYKYDEEGKLQEKTLVCAGSQEEYESMDADPEFRIPKELAALLQEHFHDGWEWYEMYECVGHGVFLGL